MTSDYPNPIVTTDVVVLTLKDGMLQLLLAQRAADAAVAPGVWALPGGFVHMDEDRSLKDTVQRVFRTKTGGEVAYLEQLCTFGSAERDPRGWSLSVAYLALVPEHKVTRLDATLDVDVDAPPVLHRLVKRARVGAGVQLTRKRILPAQVTTLLSTRLDGRLSGTAYFGSKTAPVRLCVYDKQKERVDAGVLDAPPCLRYELRLRNGLATLRDVSLPAPIFWHHMAGVLRRPVGVPAWSPAVNAYRPDRVELDPDCRLRRRVEHSPDLAALVALADSLPGGRAALFREIAWAYPLHAAAQAA